MSAGKGKPLARSLPRTHGQPTRFCRLLSILSGFPLLSLCPSVPIQAPYWKQQEPVGSGGSALPCRASGHPQPSRTPRQDAPGRTEHPYPERGGPGHLRNGPIPAQPGPDGVFVVTARIPSRRLKKKTPTLRETGARSHGKCPYSSAPALRAL